PPGPSDANERVARGAPSMGAKAGGAEAGGNRRRLLIVGVAAVLTLAVLYLSGVLGGREQADGAYEGAPASQTDSTPDSTVQPAGGGGGTGAPTAGDPAHAADSVSGETAASAPAASDAVSDWDRTHARVGEVRAEFAGEGSWNILLVVYYTGSRQE